MEYSCFTSYGQLEYSSDLPDAEKIYESMRASYIPKTGVSAVDMTPGTYHEAKVYARAMAIADANASIRRAGNQGDPLKATESIPHFEENLRLSPKPSATLEQRRAAVAIRRLLSRGPRRESIFDALTRLLGSALLAIRPIAPDEATKWPADPSIGPGVFTRTDQPSRVVRLLDPVATLGSPQVVAYENWDTRLAPIALAKGDKLSVQPETLGLAEKVTIAGVSGSGATRTFTATFTRSHDPNASASSGPVPIWASNLGHLFIVVTAVAALNAELVDKVNEQMTRLVKGGTTWSIVQPTTPGASTIGPFTLDSSPLGAVPIGTLNIVHTDPPFLGAVASAYASTAGGELRTLYGRHFTSATDVKVDGVSVAFTVVSDFRITFTTAAHADAIVGMTVVTPFGTTTTPALLTIGLAVLSVSPAEGSSSGGTAFTLRGHGFLAAIAVTVNSFTLASWTIVDDATITGVTDDIGGGDHILDVVVDDGVTTAGVPFHFKP